MLLEGLTYTVLGCVALFFGYMALCFVINAVMLPVYSAWKYLTGR
jgi:hypothetical protein